jgi:hypothetical protein
MNTQRKRGATGRLIDGDALSGAIDEGYRVDGPLLLIWTPEGPCVLLTEGVGYAVNPEGTLPVPVRGEAMSLFVELVELPAADVVAAATGAEVDIADHIRVFGARLESNYSLWYRAITGHSPHERPRLVKD